MDTETNKPKWFQDPLIVGIIIISAVLASAGHGIVFGYHIGKNQCEKAK